MDIKRLPFLPLNFFYFQFDYRTKRWFWVGMLALLFAGAFAFFALENPTFWSLGVQEVADFEEQEVKLTEIEKYHRSYELTANAYKQQVSFSAGPLLASEMPTSIFWVLQWLAWSLILAAASLIASRWNLLFYFSFILFVYFSGMGQMLIPAWSEGALSYLAALVVILPFLGLVFLLEGKRLKWAFGARFAAFALLLGLGIGGAWLQHGWIGLHEMATGSYFVYISLAIPFFYFIAKEPTNLIMALANNRRNPKQRLGMAPIIAIYTIWIITVLIIANSYIGIPGIPQGFSIGLKAIHIMIFAALIAVFTAQNHFHFVKKAFGKNDVFSFLLIGGGILSLSHLGLMSSQGDLSFIDSWDRVAAVFLLFVGLGHVIFIFSNHSRLIREKINAYYLLTLDTNFRFALVWVFALIGVIIIEGRTSWSMQHRIVHSYSTQHGDLAHLKLISQPDLSDFDKQQLINTRTRAYEFASRELVNSPKAFHNLGCFHLGSIEEINETIRLYAQAEGFPFSQLNAANLYLLKRQPEAAIELLKRAWRSSENAYVANNIGTLYAASQPDSSIRYYQAALLANLNLSSAYSNLALTYDRYDRPNEVKDFMEAALACREPSQAALANAIAFQLKSEHPFSIPPIDWDQAGYTLKFNHLLHLLAEGKKAESRELIRGFRQEELSADAMILDAYLMFQQDSMEYAISRFQYVEQLFPGKQATSYYTLGLAFLEQEVPEMAQVYFERAGDEGMPEGYLYAAQMEMSLGQLDTAYAMLSKVRVDYDELWDAASKEIATLFLIVSYDNPVYAQTEYDLSLLTQADYVRIGMLSDSINSYIPALESFRKAIALDSTDFYPYLEAGRIYNRYRDPLAAVNLRYGLQVKPDEPTLLLELAKSHLLQGKIDSAKQIVAAVTAASAALEKNKLEAQIALAEQDTSLAVERLAAAYEQRSLDQEVITSLAQIYRHQKNTDAGNQLITAALSLNTENANFWYYYAVFSTAWGQTQDAGYGALRAIELTDELARKRKIQEEFRDEIAEVVK